MFPKVLIVANSAFCLNSNDGRTLGMLLKDIPDENKKMFCLNGKTVSSELITNGYRITDFEVLENILKRQILADRLPVDLPEKSNSSVMNKPIPKTALTMLIRNFVWNLALNKTEFFPLALEYKPDIILWQLTDSPFLAKLVLTLSRRCGAKLIVYTTEDYYFKTWDYFSRKKAGLLFKFFSGQMKRSVKKLFSEAELCIANTPQLAERYEEEFHVKTAVVMASAGRIKQRGEKRKKQLTKRIVYAGNLGFNRHKALIAIAKDLFIVDSTIRLEVYGRANEKIIALLEQEPNIQVMGFVDYQCLSSILEDSLLTLHVESLEGYFRYELKSAFSTKIADSLCCGTPLFLFAPDDLALTQYLAKNDSAFVCTDRKKLIPSLKLALFDEARREQIMFNALTLAKKNHDPQKNSARMLELILEPY